MEPQRFLPDIDVGAITVDPEPLTPHTRSLADVSDFSVFLAFFSFSSPVLASGCLPDLARRYGTRRLHLTARASFPFISPLLLLVNPPTRHPSPAPLIRKEKKQQKRKSTVLRSRHSRFLSRR